MLRNLTSLAAWREDIADVWIESGETSLGALEIMSHLSLDGSSIESWLQHHEIPAPFYVDVGGGWLALPMFGGILNPVCGLARTLRLRHRGVWDAAVDGREVVFRSEIRAQLSSEHFLVPASGFKLRRQDGSQITDIDAAILDRESGTLALIQLKWPDIFGLSPTERESRRLNLLAANNWVDRVSSWIDGRSAHEICKALGITGDGAEKPPLLFVLPRYTARFTGNAKLDDRAAWIAWPELLRTLRSQTGQDNLRRLWKAFKGGGDAQTEPLPPDEVYEVAGLTARVRVTG
jgi:hypothetical protein